MRSRKTVLILVGVLALLTGVLAAVHFATRETVPEGAISVRQNGETRYVSLKDLSLTPVSGTMATGKGEKREIQAQGIHLGELARGEFHSVSVFSDDEYSAQVNTEEIDRAYLLLEEDGSARLVVFGDENAKRAVQNVARIEFA